MMVGIAAPLQADFFNAARIVTGLRVSCIKLLRYSSVASVA